MRLRPFTRPDPRTLSFRVKGAKKIDLDLSGNLSLQLGDGTIELQKPTIYQEVEGVRHAIAGNFALRGDNEVGLSVGDYDNREPLIIDPVLSYSTLIGANNNTQVQGIAVDPSGNVYIVGTTFATNYPTVAAFQSTNHGTTNVFITKLNPTGNKILYSTYLGGSGFDNAAAIAVDNSGSAYVTGTVGSSDFPTTSGAFMTTCPGFCNTPFVTKIFTDGSLAYSTFMGGSNSPAHAIAVDSAGEAYIAGDTASDDLPTTPGSFEPAYPGLICTSCYNGYVEKLNVSGAALVYSTYFGAVGFGGAPSTAGSGIAVDSAGSAYLVGNTTAIPVKNPIQLTKVGLNLLPNAFITKFSPDGSQLVFSTYLGGSSPFSAGDYATGVAVDALGNVHVTGTSGSCDFPLSLNALSTDCVTTGYTQKVFVVTLNSSGSQILFSTFLQDGFSSGIAVDKTGNSYVTGTTTSNSFPVLNPIESTSQQASSTSFVTELDASGKLLFSTYLGASSPGSPGVGSQAAGIAVDSKGGIYVAGAGQGDFPLLHPIPSEVKQNTFNTLFIAKILPKSMPQFSLSPRVSPVLALRNVSSVPLTISAIAPSANFTQGGNCGSSLAPATGCTLILEGADDKKTSGTVTISSNAYSKPQEFVISKSPTGDRVGSIVTIFPTNVQFPSQLIGTTSAPQQIVIENSGLIPAAINSIVMIQPSAFNETNNCPAMLNPASSRTISLTYTATTALDSAQLSIVADPNQTSYTAFLSGYGSTSAIVTSTATMQFGTQFMGGPALGRVANLTNTTPYPATITGVSTTAGFSQTNTCTAPLAPHASCRVSVTFDPPVNLAVTGSLSAANFGPGGPQSVSLMGTGLLVSDLAVTPFQLDFFSAFPGGSSNPQTVTLTNISSLPMTGLKFSINSSSYSQIPACPSTLAPGASCTTTVTFKPKQLGTISGILSIQHSGGGSPQIINMTGVGIVQVVVGPSPLIFPPQKIGTPSANLAIGIDNNGTTSVQIKSITLVGTEYTLSQNNCPSSLPRNFGCGFQITFKPTGIGLRTGTVTVVASDISQPHIVQLQGMGNNGGQGMLSVSSLSFSAQKVGTTSAIKMIKLTNNGSGTLNLGQITASPSFFLVSNNCGNSLAAGSSCAISVRFAPTLAGILTGTLTTNDDGDHAPHLVSLTGIGQ
jgi:hypothetical protein